MKTRKNSQKFKTVMVSVIISVLLCVSPLTVFAENGTNDEPIQITEQEFNGVLNSPEYAGRSILVGNELVYIPTQAEINTSNAVYNQRVASTPGLPRTSASLRASGTLDYTVSTQINEYYCGPATAQQVIRMWTGSLISQGTLASEIGTTESSGSSLVNNTVGAGSVEKTIESRAGVSYEQVWSPTEQQVKDCAYYGVFTSGLPSCINLKCTANSNGFPYTSSGHILSTSGYRDTNGYAEIRVADVHYDYSGHRWHTATGIYNVINATTGKILIY